MEALDLFEEAPATKQRLNQLSMKVSAVGQLLRHAEVRIAPEGGAELVVQILQRGDALPFLAIFRTHVSEIDYLRQQAERMRMGSAALVLGCGIVLTRYDGVPVLELKHVRGVLPVNAEDYRTTQDPKEAP